MSDLISSDVPQAPEFRGDMQQYSREMKVYLERVLREHYEDIKVLHEQKADTV